MPTHPNRRELIGGYDTWAHAFGLLGYVHLFNDLFVGSIEPFLRRRMGERFFTPFNFVVGFITIGLFGLVLNAFLATIPAGGIGGPAGSARGQMGMAIFNVFVDSFRGWSWLMFFIFLAYPVIGAVHLIGIWWRDRVGRDWFSLYCGDPVWLPWADKIIMPFEWLGRAIITALAGFLPNRTKEEAKHIRPVIREPRVFIEKWVEPLAVYLLGWVAILVFNQGLLAWWLWLCAPALSAHANYRYFMERMQILDMRDQLLEASFMREAMHGEPVAETAGVRVTEATRDLMKGTAERIKDNDKMKEHLQYHMPPNLTAAFEALDPTLRDMMEEERPHGNGEPADPQQTAGEPRPPRRPHSPPA